MSSKERGNGFIEFDPDLPDEDHGAALFVLCVLFSVLIILSTVSRLAMKLIMRLGLSAADCFMLITLVRISSLILFTCTHWLLTTLRHST